MNGVYNPISTDATAILIVRTGDMHGGIIDSATTQMVVNLPNPITNVSFSADQSLVQEIAKYTLQF